MKNLTVEAKRGTVTISIPDIMDPLECGGIALTVDDDFDIKLVQVEGGEAVIALNDALPQKWKVADE